MKRSIIGTLITGICTIVGMIGLSMYIINSNTNYFSGLGKSVPIILCTVLGIAALLAWCVLGDDRGGIKDILPIAAPSFFTIAFVTLLNSRINGIAAITTFEANEQNFADMQSAIMAMVFLIIAAVLSAINAFFEVKKTV